MIITLLRKTSHNKKETPDMGKIYLKFSVNSLFIFLLLCVVCARVQATGDSDPSIDNKIDSNDLIQSVRAKRAKDWNKSKKWYSPIYAQMPCEPWAIATTISLVCFAYAFYRWATRPVETLEERRKRIEQEAAQEARSKMHLFHEVDTIENLEILYDGLNDLCEKKEEEASKKRNHEAKDFFSALSMEYMKAYNAARDRINARIYKEQRESNEKKEQAREKQRFRETFGEDEWESALKEHQENKAKGELLPIRRTKKEEGLWSRIKKKIHLLFF